jgi:hypothetical protein
LLLHDRLATAEETGVEQDKVKEREELLGINIDVD